MTPRAWYDAYRGATGDRVAAVVPWSVARRGDPDACVRSALRRGETRDMARRIADDAVRAAAIARDVARGIADARAALRARDLAGAYYAFVFARIREDEGGGAPLAMALGLTTLRRVARARACPPEIAGAIAQDRDLPAVVRHIALTNPRCPWRIVEERLLLVGDVGARLAAARHRECPDDLLGDLARDADPRVRAAARKRLPRAERAALDLAEVVL